MDARKPPEFVLELSADRSNVKDVVKAILHTLLFHRLFTPLAPQTQDLLSLTLPYISDPSTTTTIDAKTTALLRHIDTLSTTTTSPQYNPTRPLRTELRLQFLEKKRKKGGWFVSKADEETVWETWVLKLEVLSARSEVEAGRNARVVERRLRKAVLGIVDVVGRERGHIPPITAGAAGGGEGVFPWRVEVGGQVK